MCRFCATTSLGGRAAGLQFPRFALTPDTGAGSAPAGSAPAKATGLLESAGEADREILIKGGVVLSVDDAIGNFAKGDVLVRGNRILEVAASIDAPEAAVIEAHGRIVMPGFIDTHSHQFETALRSTLSDAILSSDGLEANARNYVDVMLGKFSQHYRPEDVRISELFAGLSQIDAGVTGVLDVSQIHHSPEHTDAAVEGLRASRRRSVLGYFEGWGDRSRYPQDARRVREQHFASHDQLTTMLMGGELYLPGHEAAWKVGRELDLMVACHVQDHLSLAQTFEGLGRAGEFGPDNLFIHMTQMPDEAWKMAADAGAKVSFAVPIEMHMRHGEPPIQKALDLNMTVSLSSDVECTMTADMFSQMRGFITLQRMNVNAAALAGDRAYPALMRCSQAIRHATIEGAKALRLDTVTGSLTPGKRADIILLDAEAINVAPLNNVHGTVVTLMDRSNVETVICDGRILKWHGEIVGHDIAKLRRELEASRDYIFERSGIENDLFA